MSQHYKSLELCLKELKETTEEIRSTYKHANKSVSVGRLGEISEWYGSLKEAFNDWEAIHKNQRNNFFKNVRNMFSTSLYEEQGLESVSYLSLIQNLIPFLLLISKLVTARNEISDLYKEKKIALQQLKEKLHQKGDLAKWKIDREKTDITLQQLSDNKELAMKHMLPHVMTIYLNIY